MIQSQLKKRNFVAGVNMSRATKCLVGDCAVEVKKCLVDRVKLFPRTLASCLKQTLIAAYRICII